jgi:hypothetical protein
MPDLWRYPYMNLTLGDGTNYQVAECVIFPISQSGTVNFRLIRIQASEILM